MRFILPCLFLLFLAPGFAAAEQPAPNPVDALKKSLQKDPAPAHAPVKSTEPHVETPTWISLSRTQREKILQDWLAQPETTRQPFPLYRDATLEGKPVTPTAEATPRPFVAVKEKKSGAK